MKMKKLFKQSSFAILLVLCLTFFSLFQTIDAKSRYKSESNGTSDTELAEWNVSLTPVTTGNEFNIIAGNTTADYLVKVKSNSQVSCRYSIIISNIPNDIIVTLDDGDEQSPTDNKVIFNNAGSFIIGDNVEENTHKLSFSAPIESNVNNNQINIQAAFTQID